MKKKLSAKKITIWICVNYGIFILGFFILGSMGIDKYIVGRVLSRTYVRAPCKPLFYMGFRAV